MSGTADEPPGLALPFTALAGWNTADHASAWRVFRASAAAVVAGTRSLRDAQPPSAAFRASCEAAASMPERLAAGAARGFFEDAFTPRRLRPEGFLTGYYEPVVEGALVRGPGFTAPIIGRPAFLEGLRSEPVPDRAALEAFAVSAAADPVVWLADWVEAFLIHVQGSARIRLPDGSLRRLFYAGRNGLPYTSIGRRLVETGRMAASDMSLAALKGWLRDAGQEVGQPGRALMQENRSFIFFRLEEGDAPEAGPVGGQGLPLTAGTSIAVDRSLWSYGLPFVIAAAGPLPGFAADPFSGLFIAQDTGSAIVGPARVDLFLGSGEAAGAAAGSIRHPATVTVLWPRAG